MKPRIPQVLPTNGGSSSIEFALVQVGEQPRRTLIGNIDRIGLSGTTLTFTQLKQDQPCTKSIRRFDHKSVEKFAINWFKRRIDFDSVKCWRGNTP